MRHAKCRVVIWMAHRRRRNDIVCNVHPLSSNGNRQKDIKWRKQTSQIIGSQMCDCALNKITDDRADVDEWSSSEYKPPLRGP